jgi:two-component system, cell cycle sensor histidine kinase and response regulator CckA
LEAENGVQGWEIYHAAQGKIDLLVTDLQMPDMSGQELLALVREHNPAFKVLCISGNPAQLTAGQPDASEMNRVSFLWKPFTPGKVAGRIRALLDYRLPKAGQP